jgi:16S rRNA (guanine966-N2)-methyltransferase
LRPSSDRVRETVFNWLTPYLPGAVCLDLFAGTGALGFEAVSRGAAHATLVEKDRVAVEYLHRHHAKLSSSNISIVQADALQWMHATDLGALDIVFLDPPFDTTLLTDALEIIAQAALNNRALVYLEAEKIPILTLHAHGWRLFKHSHTRHVEFALAMHAEPAEVQSERKVPVDE